MTGWLLDGYEWPLLGSPLSVTEKKKDFYVAKDALI